MSVGAFISFVLFSKAQFSSCPSMQNLQGRGVPSTEGPSNGFVWNFAQTRGEKYLTLTWDRVGPTLLRRSSVR